ncbi:hypothetical protein [Methanobrevibacter sp.]|uniref:hypothetical protein n=1 Tax=Methanobrevibacter sp. TaxID=66852 RepID=UPI0038706780
MKLKYFILVSAVLVLFLGVSSVSAHGADLTEDTMIIANESNGILAKSIVDNNSFDIKVYKFVSEGDVEHQLEHALTNPNKRILAIAYQDTVNDYLKGHPELKDRIIVSEDDNESITNNAHQLLLINVGGGSSNDFIMPLGVGLVIGAIIGLICGVFIMKRKS